jgi:hypothetical protein
MLKERVMKNVVLYTVLLICVAFLFTSCAKEEPQEPQWISMFNGENLDGWTPKFAGHELGENYLDTFQAGDGVLRVVYDNHEKFDNKFGHLFYKDSFSHYKFRCEYRFVGDQVAEGPGWAFRNNGVMIHCQDPKTMQIDQNFPVCIEVQLLGGNGEDERSTGNLCTPSTNVVLNDQLELQHCINSVSETFHGDQWVTCEIEVNGGDVITHKINGQDVLSYKAPQLDERDEYAKAMLDAGADLIITKGYISFQAESHPTEFRNIEIMSLD